MEADVLKRVLLPVALQHLNDVFISTDGLNEPSDTWALIVPFFCFNK